MIGEFWKYASTIKQPMTLEDAFLKWAASKKLPLAEAQDIWAKIATITANAFNKKAVEVTVDGTPEEVNETLTTFQKSDNTPVDSAMQVEEKPAEEPKTIFQSLEGEEEEAPIGQPALPAENPALAGGTMPAGGGNVAPGGAPGGMPATLPPLK